MKTERELILAAYEAQRYSYSPYSNFQVGAALLGKNGEVYLGCNIENAAYSPTNCAERTAFFKAVSQGCRQFEAIAIVGNKKGEQGDYCPPCGVCRQVMAEFCHPDEFKVILARSPEEYRVYRLRELLPFGFGNETMVNGYDAWQRHHQS
ncbi:MAG: cytidine deaminase [Lachnospiraceae bacterium]|nr:cytidine deaminase [Robinsoniella sp.]MDY3767008.1 cytidine deaminase [Lachnospiraceae bacterium]